MLSRFHAIGSPRRRVHAAAREPLGSFTTTWATPERAVRPGRRPGGLHDLADPPTPTRWRPCGRPWPALLDPQRVVRLAKDDQNSGGHHGGRRPALQIERASATPVGSRMGAPRRPVPDTAARPASPCWRSSADGLRLNVAEWGAADGVPIVMLHGIRGYLLTFERIAAGLPPHWRAIAFDQRDARRRLGCAAPLRDTGTYRRRPGPRGRSAAGPGRFRLLGHSMGGINAIVTPASTPSAWPAWSWRTPARAPSTFGRRATHPAQLRETRPPSTTGPRPGPS